MFSTLPVTPIQDSKIVQGAKKRVHCCSRLSAAVLHGSGSGQHYSRSSNVGVQSGFPSIITTGTFLDDLHNQLWLSVKQQNQKPTSPKTASATALAPYKSIHHLWCECEQRCKKRVKFSCFIHILELQTSGNCL